jgi:hypothetical protein
MKANSKTAKQGLVIAVTLVVGFTSLAAAYLPQSANAARRRTVVYYRAVPYWRNHVPYEVGYTDYGIYRQFVLPDGTLTGPIAPEANGG